MTELAYLNGVFSPIAEARVSIEDRGFQFGDGVYEVIVAYDGRPFLLDQHLARLRRSVEAIGLDFDFDENPIGLILAEGLKRSGLGDAMMYVQITRGTCARNHVIPEGLVPTVVATFKSLPTIPGESRQRGASVMTTLDKRWASCYVKAITLLPNVMAKNAALRKGYDDAVFVTATGEVRECTAANLFIVQGGSITTPPRGEHVLHGVTQGFIMECAGAVGLSVEENSFDVATLCRADEVFMSSTTAEVLGVTSVDGKRIADGRVGRVTQRLYAEFLKRSRNRANDAVPAGRRHS